MTHEEKVARWIGRGKIGTEIGAGTAPVPGLAPPPIYVDCFKEFGAAPNRADYYGHACALPFHDNSLDYVVASHVLEHVANPVAALAEWCRVLRPSGIIHVVVPDRRATWEHRRALTPVAHLLDDYVRGITAVDDTHIDDFVFQADWSIYRPSTPAKAVQEQMADLARGMHEAVARGEEINIHFHTFEPENFRELIETLPDWSPCPLRWEIVDFAARFPASNPNGVLAVLRVHKSWREHADLEARRVRTGGDPRAVLRDDAQSFDSWAAKTADPGGRTLV
jgi:SAM-dependent methyltransferase